MEQLINAAACLFETCHEGHAAIECGTKKASYGELRQPVACAAFAREILGASTAC